ncbi:MAG: hypothetical protein LBU73_05350 [Helicobacteraceae bacterium]|jgi:hypothetical protein|nr:hypothetical protein [Helicobacteraceae bacterium]
MKRILIFLTLFSAALACSGDCLSCHPKLSGEIGRDLDHKTLSACVLCHKDVENPKAECGGNCLSCHVKVGKETREHGALEGCKICHITSGGKSNFVNKMFGVETLEKKIQNYK